MRLRLRIVIYGASPQTPLKEKGICEAPPRAPLVREIYMRGFTPHPDSRTFLGKSPQDPKKPNCICFRLSNIDSKQGCRAATLFLRSWRTAPADNIVHAARARTHHKAPALAPHPRRAVRRRIISPRPPHRAKNPFVCPLKL